MSTSTGKQISLPSEGESKIDLFEKKQVRKTMHENQWWFSVKDVLEVLTDTTDGNRYSRDLRAKDAGLQERWAEITRTLPFASGSGKQETTFVNIEGLFRLMQSVPTKKAEPFKKWLAKVGFERLKEIQNPEFAITRAITLYRAKGYDDGWIDARIRNKVSREALTAEWSRRGAGDYFGLLTDAISIETFGIKTSEHRAIKGLTSQNLRDNMTPIELTLTTLGEQASTEITKATNAHGLQENMNAAKRGGTIAGTARQQIESATGQKVVSPKNYLTERQRLANAQSIHEFDDIMKRMLQIPSAEAEQN